MNALWLPLFASACVTLGVFVNRRLSSVRCQRCGRSCTDFVLQGERRVCVVCVERELVHLKQVHAALLHSVFETEHVQ